MGKEVKGSYQPKSKKRGRAVKRKKKNQSEKERR